MKGTSMNLRDMTIGIVGGGVVGQATARAYLEHVKEVRVWDVLPERRTDDLRRVLECDLIFVCLPTPQKDGMGLDVSEVNDFFFELSRPQCDSNFVLRSTVPIGTTRRLREQYGLTNLVHSPEFLTARCATVDAQMPARNIIGVPSGDRLAHLMPKGCPRALFLLQAERFPGVPVHVMSSDESEAVKLFQNGIFAATVSLWNELRSLSDKLGLTWDRVREAILADGRISPSHTQVPGPSGEFGFGGSCLPKDLSQLLQHFYEAEMPAKVLDGVWHRNWEYDRKENK